MNLADLTYNEAGLIPCIVQDANTHEVLMMAWMNEEAVRLNPRREDHLVLVAFAATSSGTRAKSLATRKSWSICATIATRTRCSRS